jgi:hypothetical protein
VRMPAAAAGRRRRGWGAREFVGTRGGVICSCCVLLVLALRRAVMSYVRVGARASDCRDVSERCNRLTLEFRCS